MSKLLTVFGATGQQGGSLINYVLNHPKLSEAFRLRGITRDTSKPQAVALKEKGVELVQADMSDPASLVPAVAGSYAVFGMTNYWDTRSGEMETAQGKAMADASVAAGAELFIWSSLPNMTTMTEGRVTGATNFDSKAAVEDYVRGLPITSFFFMAGWYMQNHLQFMRPKIDENGNAFLSTPYSPTSPVPCIDITDIGKFVAPGLLDPQKYHGKIFYGAEAYYTCVQIAEILSKATGKEMKYVQGGWKDRGLPDEMVEQLGKMDKLFELDSGYFGPSGKDDVAWTLKQLDDKPTTFEEFARTNGPWFPTA